MDIRSKRAPMKTFVIFISGPNERCRAAFSQEYINQSIERYKEMETIRSKTCKAARNRVKELDRYSYAWVYGLRIK